MTNLRRKIGLAVLGLLCASAWAASVAQAQTRLHVSQVGPVVREADPGEVVTLPFNIRHDAPAALTFQSTVRIPAGWRLVTRPAPIRVAPGEAGMCLVSVAVPERASAGAYTVAFAVADAARSASGSDSAQIQVRPKRSVSARLLEAPRYVAAGRAFQARFLISNEGNVPERIDLAMDLPPEYLAELDQTTLNLGPYASAEVSALVRTPGVLTWESYHAGSLRASVAGGERLTVSYALDVLPAVAVRDDPFRRLPGELGVRSIMQNGRLYPQLDLRGNGRGVLREGDEMELLLRGPNLLTRSVLGEMDEYALRYRTGRYRAQLGDATYTLSTLTEPGVRGLGGSVEGQIGRWTLGSYAQQTRYYFPRERQAGAFARYAVLDPLTVGVNYLGKSGRYAGQLLTVQSELRTGPDARLSVEAGGDLTQGRGNLGFSADVFGRTDRYAYSARFLKAGEGFNSPYRGVTFGSGSGRYAVSRAVAFEASFFDQSRRGIRGISFGAPQRFAFYRAGGRFYNRAGVFYVLERREDGGTLERQDQGVQVDLRQPLGAAALVARATAGARRYRTLADPFPYAQYDLAAYFRLGERQSVYLSVGGEEDRNPFSGRAERRISFSGGGSVAVAGGLRAALNLNHSRAFSASAYAFTSADAQLSYSFRSGHRLVLQGRWFGFGGRLGTDEAFSLSYVAPLRLPLGRSRSSGVVEGRVYDLETGEGLENVQISLGDAAVVTRGDGTYAFRGIAPAEYVLAVEGIGADRIASRTIPARLTVSGGETATVDVGVGPASSLSGQVVRYGPRAAGRLAQESDRRLEPLGGQRSLVVEARSGADVQRRLTDAQGRFVFNNLRPGAWTLKIAGGSVPEGYRPEDDSLALTLTPGEEGRVEVRLVPIRRNVQIVSGGSLTLEPPGEQPAPASPSPGSTRWVVRPSESSLMDVAKIAYGDPALWPKIWLANRQAVPDPEHVRPGQILVLPLAAALTEQELKAQEAYEAARRPGRR